MHNLHSIQAKAKNLGFNFSGITSLRQTPHFSKFLMWLEKKQYGQLDFLNMEYVVRSRRDPSKLLLNAQSMIVLGVNYGPDTTTKQPCLKNDARIAAYAQYEDYHKIIKSKAIELMTLINNQRLENAKYRIFIDSGPVMEKDFAYSAGMGWIGKQSLLIHPRYGSFTHLCCIITDEKFDHSPCVYEDLCGDCQMCVQACPAGCISEDHTINASRCISYLTIEHRGIIPRDMRSKIGNWIFGCDICQDVCPHNKHVSISQSNIFFGYPKKFDQNLDLLVEFGISKKDYSEKYIATPIRRMPYDQYLRNLIIAAGNSREKRYVEILTKILLNGAENLRVHAIWALGEIAHDDCLKILQVQFDGESSQLVKNEILYTLNKLT